MSSAIRSVSAEEDAWRVNVTRMLTLFARTLANGPAIDGELVAIWTQVLRHAGIRPEELSAMTQQVLVTERFFPTPAVVIAAARPPEVEDALAELAWQRTLGMVRTLGHYASINVGDCDGDSLTLWVLERMGWPRLCAELTSENRSIFRAEFIRLWRAGRACGASACHVPGAHEITNSGLSLADPRFIGRPAETLPPGVPALNDTEEGWERVDPQAVAALFAGAQIKTLPEGGAGDGR